MVSLLLLATGSACGRTVMPTATAEYSYVETILATKQPGFAGPSNVNKLDSSLRDLLAAYWSGGDLSEAAKASGLRVNDKKEVLLDIYVTDSVSQAAVQLKSLGMSVLATNDGAGVVEGYLPIDQLLPAAGLDFTRAFVAVKAFGTNTEPP